MVNPEISETKGSPDYYTETVAVVTVTSKVLVPIIGPHELQAFHFGSVEDGNHFLQIFAHLAPFSYLLPVAA
jgi:hypothetical protein